MVQYRRSTPRMEEATMGEQADPGRLRSTFDAVATLYDEARPGYPERLFDDLASLSDTESGAKVLEICCGTAQATVPLARRGYHVLCVELGENLATIARGKLADYLQEARVLASSFEQWPLKEGPSSWSSRPRRFTGSTRRSATARAPEPPAGRLAHAPVECLRPRR
jgi:SAM-dependent methyltransferase